MESKTKKRKNNQPVEQHQTAAWQNSNQRQRLTNVIITDEEAALLAKDYVDTNQK